MNTPSALNRSLITVFFTEKFFALIQPYLVDDIPDITLDDLNADPIMLLVPPCDDETVDDEIAANEELITQAVFSLFLDDDQTPPALTEGFNSYFDIEFSEDVYDLASEYALEYADEDADGEEISEEPAFQ